MSTNNCYTGTAITQITDECGNNFVSTNCIQTPNALVYLDLPEGATQSEINAAVVAALTYKDQQIAEIPVPDGSETFVEAGTNVTITGIGTEADPYVVTSPLQDLQSVLDEGGYASVDAGLASLEVFGGSVGNKYLEFFSNSADFVKSSNIRMYADYTIIQNYGAAYWSQLSMDGGTFNFRKTKVVGGLATSISIANPVVATTVDFPAKTVSGAYNVVLEPVATYLVSTLPAAQLGDRAVVTDATAPTYLGTPVGGGSIVAPVWYNGTAWKYN